VFEEAYTKAYLPMLECLERHSKVRLALHYTGPLRDWLNETHPDFFPKLRILVERGQIEIMTGSYYEAVLVSLSDEDKLGQIRKQTDSIKKDFGYDATGLWLAERIWEPHLPRSLAEAGVEYTVVDDSHFKAIGYTDDDLFGYYVSEEQGRTVRVFATSMRLRYSIPWSPVESVLEWLRDQFELESSNGKYIGRTRIAVMGDDGEKFGLWPGTYEHLWVDGWMDDFFTALEENSEWLQTTTLADASRNYPSLGRIYLPTASYDEMGEWAMPPDESWELHHLKHQLNADGHKDITRYMRGGVWRNFMVKYPEVNQLHKKAQFVSRKVHAMSPGSAKNQALDHLWAGQCNCGYWHGTFGGIYLFHIREANYRQLLLAENLADRLAGKKKVKLARVEVLDFDLDASPDVVITTDQQNFVFDLDQGGSLVEWDNRPAAYNLINALTRRREGYHRDLVEAAKDGKVLTPDMKNDGTPENIHSDTVRAREADLDQKLLYDWHRRASFMDHFLGANVTLDDFYKATYQELGDFVDQPYQQDITGKTGNIALRLWREGHVWQGAASLPVSVEKMITTGPDSEKIAVTYTITNGEGIRLDTRFGIEFNWGLAGGDQLAYAYVLLGDDKHSLGEQGNHEDMSSLSIISDLWKLSVSLEWDQKSHVWWFPLETISNSEAGFERNYQGTTMLLWWPVSLAPGETWKATLLASIGYKE
jgi:alpha-amylase